MLWGVKRLGFRLATIKLVLEEGILHTISAYATQVRSDESVKREDWEEMEGLRREIPTSETFFFYEGAWACRKG